jgi:hypothetical protein
MAHSEEYETALQEARALVVDLRQAGEVRAAKELERGLERIIAWADTTKAPRVWLWGDDDEQVPLDVIGRTMHFESETGSMSLFIEAEGLTVSTDDGELIVRPDHNEIQVTVEPIRQQA